MGSPQHAETLRFETLEIETILITFILDVLCGFETFFVFLRRKLRPGQFLHQDKVVRFQQSRICIQACGIYRAILEHGDLSLKLLEGGVIFEIGELGFD